MYTLTITRLSAVASTRYDAACAHFTITREDSK
jgi:hypothetical protein